MDFPFSFDPYIGVLTLNTRFCGFSVNLARKPEGVGVRGQGKVAFSHALWLPLPQKPAYQRTVFLTGCSAVTGAWRLRFNAPTPAPLAVTLCTPVLFARLARRTILTAVSQLKLRELSRQSFYVVGLGSMKARPTTFSFFCCSLCSFS